MTDYDIRPLQIKLLDTLKAIDDMCRQNGLKYYLLDGTLLGAVRHKGFIPWDDDIDIGMPRKDYEKLVLHSKEWLPERFEFISFESDINYSQHYGKIQDRTTTLIEKQYRYYVGGIFIDIFPIDGISESVVKQKIYFKQYRILKKILYFLYRDPYKHGHGPSCWIPLLVIKLFNREHVHRIMKRHMMKYDYDSCRYVTTNINDGMKGVADKINVLGDPTPVSFENMEFMGMRNNHEYLKKLFGDYMTPPPAGKRRQHNFEYLDLDTPFEDYLKKNANQ